MIFLPKPGKATYASPKSFRPITLSSFLMKVLERIIQWELLEILPDSLENQFAFTTGSSTEQPLSIVVDNIEAAICNKIFALSVFLDIAGAFDNISFDAIDEALSYHEIPQMFKNIITFNLRHRLTVLDYKGCRIKGIPTRGTPQGECYLLSCGTCVWTTC